MSSSAVAPAALVTGASRGIGRAIAEELARLGYRVAVNYASRPDAAAAVVQEIVRHGGQAVALQADISHAGDRQRLMDETLAAYDRLDVLVNNAGITSVGRHDILDASEAGWDQVFNTNLKAPFFLSQRAARQMMQQTAAGVAVGGKIINISSVSAYAVSTNRADYCMTKAALRMMTWLFAERLAVEQIGVYEVCPGVIASDMTAPVKEKYDKLIADGLWPIRRWGQPEDVARAVAAIVQGFFPFSTGECFNVDGGFHIRRL